MKPIRYQKVNGKYQYPKLAMPFYGDVSLGNMTQFKVFVMMVDERLALGVEGKGFYTFYGFTHPSYVYEKLNVYVSDAKSIADFINAQFGNATHFQDIVDERFAE